MRIRFTKVAPIAIALLAVLIGGYYTWQYYTRPSDPMAAYAQNAATADTSMIKEMSTGNPDAKVTVIEYGWFTCPHCAHFAEAEFPTLKASYIDTGKIKFTFREVYWNLPSLWAGIIARCGPNAEDRFFGMVDQIYAQQRDWATQKTAGEVVDKLKRIAKAAGVTDAELDQCLKDENKAQALYALSQKYSNAVGINSTPTFVVNGTKLSGVTYEELSAAIDKALAGG